MRALVLLSAIALSLGACGKSDEAERDAQGSAMTANAISSNDITAIDAVTGEAANIAADVQIDANLLAEANAGNASAPADGSRPRRGDRPGPSTGSRAPAPANDAAPAAEPVANSAE
jgi:hypothetical protein